MPCATKFPTPAEARALQHQGTCATTSRKTQVFTHCCEGKREDVCIWQPYHSLGYFQQTVRITRSLDLLGDLFPSLGGELTCIEMLTSKHFTGRKCSKINHCINKELRFSWFCNNGELWIYNIKTIRKWNYPVILSFIKHLLGAHAVPDIKIHQ